MKDERKSAPVLRFNGFFDAWELRKLSTEFEKVNERNDGSLGKEHWISVAKMYFQNPDKVQSNNIDTRTYVMRTGDIAFEGHPNKEFKFGRFIANDIGTGVVSELFPIYRHKQEYNNYYWKNAIQIERVMGPIFAKSITSSGNSSNKLDPNHFLRQQVFIPKLEEQNKIGMFFKRFNDTIALHQRKLDILKQMKKGFLQQLFPENEEKVPGVRFAYFEEEWALCKFIDIVDRVNLSSNSNELPRVEFEDIVAGEGRLNKDITEKLDGRKGTIFQPNNILYGKLRPYLKNWLQPNFKGIALGDFWVFEAKNTDAKFDYYLIQADKYQKVANDTSGTKMPRSDWRLVSNTSFLIPKKDEQTKIGTFFKHLDDTITLHQQKLDQLKTLKKAYLQNMFI
ncbi:restriction endonuclease subunit S [Listeria rocourtiae]|uniref:restriction endonuclease subunit S n=1 Tax=Listeria rocourtiae TaxID=647910 RepID=UPI001627FC64|nr:restriction endonuclease subunit S [Listeria rocourtiae]MBC1604245.1 restriction endonuclease subunit S [Listeria rocourtiae]